MIELHWLKRKKETSLNSSKRTIYSTNMHVTLNSNVTHKYLSIHKLQDLLFGVKYQCSRHDENFADLKHVV